MPLHLEDLRLRQRAERPKRAEPYFFHAADMHYITFHIILFLRFLRYMPYYWFLFVSMFLICFRSSLFHADILLYWCLFLFSSETEPAYSYIKISLQLSPPIYRYYSLRGHWFWFMKRHYAIVRHHYAIAFIYIVYFQRHCHAIGQPMSHISEAELHTFLFSLFVPQTQPRHIQRETCCHSQLLWKDFFSFSLHIFHI